METPERIVIVGGGLAGAHAAFGLREAGFGGEVTLVNAEDQLPYERPPLSKKYLAGKRPLHKLRVKPAEAYEEARIALELGRRVECIDRGARTVSLDDGRALQWDRLLLATGSAPRPLNAPGEDLPGVHLLRTIEDSDSIAAEAADVERVVVIGGGWIGSEVAATLREAGKDVVQVGNTDLPLSQFLGRRVARVFADAHREHGVERVAGRVVELVGGKDGRVSAVRLHDGRVVPAELVVVGIGAAPDLTLAKSAGLATAQGGVAVDDRLRGSEPRIFAAGDLAAAEHPVYGRRLRVEHWDNAIEQGKLAARNMLGADEAYDRRPYFFTDQYDLGMEFRGVPRDLDDVVLSGDVAGRTFQAFWLDGDRVVAAMHVNDWDASDALAELVERSAVVDREQLRERGAKMAEPITA